MRIYRRGKTYWAQYRGRRFSLRTSDRKAAELAFAAFQRRQADPANAAADNASLADWISKLLETKERNRSHGTASMYAVKAGHVLRIFGEDATMSEITPGAVDAYVAARQTEGASNNTIGKELTTILQVCKLAKRSGEFSGDLSSLRPHDFRINYSPREAILSHENEVKLRKAATPEQWAAIAWILGTGCRLSEALAARPEDLDWRRLEVRIRGSKTSKARAAIPILKATAPYLREAEGFLPFRWKRLSKGIPELCEASGVPRVTPNDLRRTAATRLLEAGADPYDVARVTRHASLGMLFRIYDRLGTSGTRERLERRMGERSRGTKSVHKGSGGRRPRKKKSKRS